MFVLRDPLGEVVVRVASAGVWHESRDATSDVVGKDWWALPGLVDAHSHLAAPELNYQPGDLDGAMQRARDALAAGVTLLLDKGWTDDTAVRVIDEVPEEERPDIEAAARIIAPEDGYFPGFARDLDDGLVETVRNEAAAGRGWVKVIGDWPRRGLGPVANFTEDELRTVVRVASEAGAKVAIHTMASDAPGMAVRAGVHSIEHGLFLSEDDIAMLGARSGMWVPTFLRVETVIAQLGSESTGGKLLQSGLANASRLLADAVDAGVHVLAGTDLVGTPANVAAEALKMGEYGLSPERMIAAVSSSGHEATGRSARFDVGSSADAVFYPVNPLDEPGVLAHPVMVLRKGRQL